MKNISKKFLSLLVSICMVISVFPIAASAAEVSKSWKYVGGARLSNESADFISTAKDSDGKLYVAFRDNANSLCDCKSLRFGHKFMEYGRGSEYIRRIRDGAVADHQ